MFGLWLAPPLVLLALALAHLPVFFFLPAPAALERQLPPRILNPSARDGSAIELS